MSDESYDCIVVGAGSAGAIIASRLSEDVRLSVLLVEGGPDYVDEAATPDALLDSLDVEGAHDWRFSAKVLDDRSIPYQRGKVAGGTSAINATALQWPRQAHIDNWSKLGNAAWSWREVASILKGLESDLDAPGEHHGRSGPVPVSRYGMHELIPIQKAFYEACLASGIQAVGDHNALEGSGVGPFPMNRRGRTRVSTAISHLAGARSRANLTIRDGTLVNCVLLEGSEASGLVLQDGTVVTASTIILSAGAISSPAILMRSGVGSADQLEALGVSPRIALPGVGARLWDHPGIPIRLVPRPGECVMGRDPRVQIMANFTATDSPMTNDMQLVLRSHLNISGAPAWLADAGVPVVAALIVALMEPLSRGRLRLVDRNPESQPLIELNFFDHPEDVRRAISGIRLAWKVLHTSEFKAGYERISGLTQEVVENDDLLAAYIRSSCGTYCHAMGTLPMGPASDPMSVVDQSCKVHGVDNLYVVDASVIPAALPVVPNMTVMMLGERFAHSYVSGAMAS